MELLGVTEEEWGQLSASVQSDRLAGFLRTLDDGGEPRRSWKRCALARLSAAVAMKIESDMDDRWQAFAASQSSPGPPGGVGDRVGLPTGVASPSAWLSQFHGIMWARGATST